MPYDWNNILVVTKEELVPKYYNCNTLYSLLQRYKNKTYGIKRVQRACYNRSLLISFHSLPKEIQEAIGNPHQINSILERYYETDYEAITFFSTYKVGIKGTLSLEAQKEYTINANVLQAVIKLKKDREQERINKGMGSRGIMGTISSDVNGFNRVLSVKYSIQHTLPSSKRKFEQKYKQFIKEGYAALISKKYNNRNAVKNKENIRSLLESMFVSQPHKPTPTEIAEQYNCFLRGEVEIINTITGEIYDPRDFTKLNRRSVTSFLNSWKSKVATFKKRNGNRQKYMETFTPYEQMEHVHFSGTIISIDDRQPPFNYESNKRIWFYNAIDLGSECLTAWAYGKTKEGIIIDFYRQLIRNYAEWNLPLPYELECESSLNSNFRNSFLQEGILFKKIRIEANNARLKRCERYWGDLRYGMEKKREGWIARPNARRESNQASSQKKVIIPYDRLVKECLHDIQTWNNMPHSIYKDKTRWEIFLENQNPDNFNPINYHSVLPYLGFKTQSSCKQGQLRLNHAWYLLGGEDRIYTGEKLIDILSRIEGHPLDIYWLDGNDGKILKALVYLHGSSRCICEAIPKPVTSRSELEETPGQRENRTIMQHYRNTVEGYATRKKNAIEKVTVIDKRPVTLNEKFKIRGLHETELMLSPEEVEDLERNYTDNPEPVTISFKKELSEIF